MLCPKHEGTTLIRHVCNYLPVYTALRPEDFNLYQPCSQHLRSSYVLQEWIAKNHQELATMMLITTLVVSFLVCCMLEVRCD